MEHRRLRQERALALLLGISLLLVPAPPRAVTAQSTTSCATTPEAPGPADQALAGSTGELSLDQKHAAFNEVLTSAVRYGDYVYPVAVTRTQQTFLYPILLKSVAGIESGWTQYRDGQTLINASCDFGLLQINEVARASLFANQPSLRSDTRGNIAAAAQTLSELWAQGQFGTLPVVNDGDPSWLPNWYYVLSTYNGGPGGVWANNPACGGVLACFVGGKSLSYLSSRPEKTLANWNDLGSGLYPYQERVLYNLLFPRKLSQHPLEKEPEEVREWQAAGLGFKAITPLGDTGMRSEDSVFVRRDPTTGALVSFAPNLLLFRHRAAAVRSDLDAQWIFFEYDLPFSAQITITLQLGDGSERPLCSRAGAAGWNQHFCRAAGRLQSGDAYRIRAQRGSPDRPASHYLGQYVQALACEDGPQQIQSLAPIAYLPLVQNTGRPMGLLDSSFTLSDQLEDWKPDYWDVQALVSRPAGAELPDVTTLQQRADRLSHRDHRDHRGRGFLLRVLCDLCGSTVLGCAVVRRSNAPLGWRLNAAPGGVVDLRQRIALEPGTYLLKVRLDVQGKDAASVLSIRTRPAAPGPQPWSLVASIEATGTGPQDNGYRLRLDGPTTISLLAAFGPDDGLSAFILRAVELFR